jgi:hypothetical protein
VTTNACTKQNTTCLLRVRAKKTGVEITRAFLRYRKKNQYQKKYFSEFCLTHVRIRTRWSMLGPRVNPYPLSARGRLENNRKSLHTATIPRQGARARHAIARYYVESEYSNNNKNNSLINRFYYIAQYALTSSATVTSYPSTLPEKT